MAVDIYISEEKIATRISEIGMQISRDYRDSEIVLVGILNGAFVFMADLARQISLPCRIEFMSVSSYSGVDSTGELKIELDLRKSIDGKDVILVEDIVDTGLTVSSLREIIQRKNPRSLRVASFLYKPARIKHPVNIDYLAFEIEDKFVVGYGLDFDGRYRELPYIGVYSEN